MKNTLKYTSSVLALVILSATVQASATDGQPKKTWSNWAASSGIMGKTAKLNAQDVRQQAGNIQEAEKANKAQTQAAIAAKVKAYKQTDDVLWAEIEQKIGGAFKSYVEKPLKETKDRALTELQGNVDKNLKEQPFMVTAQYLDTLRLSFVNVVPNNRLRVKIKVPKAYLRDDQSTN